MSSPVEAEEQELPNPDENGADAPSNGQDTASFIAAVQQAQNMPEITQQEGGVGPETVSTSAASAGGAEPESDTNDSPIQENAVDDMTGRSSNAERAAFQPLSTDDTDTASPSRQQDDAATASLSQEGYYPDQEDRPMWGSSAADTSALREDIADIERQGRQQQEDLEERPSSREDAGDSDAVSALQPSGASAAIQAALSNPELDPDHPLLQRAQKALEKQLLASKYRLESEVREKSIALQVCFAHDRMQCVCPGFRIFTAQLQNPMQPLRMLCTRLA